MVTKKEMETEISELKASLRKLDEHLQAHKEKVYNQSNMIDDLKGRLENVTAIRGQYYTELQLERAKAKAYRDALTIVSSKADQTER